MDDFSFLTYIGASIIALFVGFLTGVFGVGGGFLMSPALIILLGVPGNIAVGTDLAMILFNSSVGLIKRQKSKTVDVKLAATLACGSIAGVAVGVFIMAQLKDMQPLVVLGKEQPAMKYILLWLFLVLLIAIAGLIAFELYRNRGKNPEMRIGMFARFKIPPYMNFTSLDRPQLSVIPVVVLGLGVGILTGLLGVGGGVILLPALVYLIGQRTVKAAGTSLLLVWISSLFGAVTHLTQRNINPLLLLAMLVGGVLGTYVGTHIGLKTSGPKLRLYFVWVVLLAVVMVGVKLCSLTFG